MLRDVCRLGVAGHPSEAGRDEWVRYLRRPAEVAAVHVGWGGGQVSVQRALPIPLGRCVETAGPARIRRHPLGRPGGAAARTCRRYIPRPACRCAWVHGRHRQRSCGYVKAGAPRKWCMLVCLYAACWLVAWLVVQRVPMSQRWNWNWTNGVAESSRCQG
jgi:hypothetical protein